VSTLGGRAVLKVQASHALHKSELGFVRVGVPEDEADAVAAELLAAAGTEADGVLVQELIPPGFELLVSITRESPDLPPLLTVGAGGTATEIWRDVATSPLPVTADEVRGMLGRLQSSPLLNGHRGKPKCDVAAAVDAVMGLIRAAELVGPRLGELEVNPLIVLQEGKGAFAADVLLRLSPDEGA
jgi:acyl-CoA synthetase (NDP forming)